MTLFNLNIGQKMLRFWKVTLANPKIGKLSVTQSQADSKQKFFLKGFITKNESGGKMPFPRAK